MTEDVTDKKYTLEDFDSPEVKPGDRISLILFIKKGELYTDSGTVLEKSHTDEGDKGKDGLWVDLDDAETHDTEEEKSYSKEVKLYDNGTPNGRRRKI